MTGPTVKLGATSLMYACQQGKESQVNEIIKTKVSKPGTILERERSLKTALHYCAESGDGGVESAAALLRVAPELVSAQDQDGYTALHLAVIAGNVQLAKLLIAHGADVNTPDNEGHTSSHWATVCGEIECLDLILKKKGNPNLGDMHGGCPLHYAAQMCGPGSEMPADRRLGMTALRLLIDYSANPNIPDNHGRQPILWAASAGSSEAILVLTNAGANVEAADQDGLTALHCAASRGHTDCVETLINLCNAEADVIDNNGCSPLFYAVTLGHADCTQALLNHGANTNRQDRKGRTAMHCGAAKGQLETLKVVWNRGGNLWTRTARGDYPLHEAVTSGRCDLVTWLLSLRPDAVNAPNNDGRCPLHLSAIHNNIEMSKVLLDAGSLVNPVMRTGKGLLATPLDAALHKGHRGAAKYLQLHGGVPASRLNSEFAALRGPNSRNTGFQNPQPLESEKDLVGEHPVSSRQQGPTPQQSEIKMPPQKQKILQVYVEDGVMIKRLKPLQAGEGDERIRRRRRKRKSRQVIDKSIIKEKERYRRGYQGSTDEEVDTSLTSSVVENKLKSESDTDSAKKDGQQRDFLSAKETDAKQDLEAKEIEESHQVEDNEKNLEVLSETVKEQVILQKLLDNDEIKPSEAEIHETMDNETNKEETVDSCEDQLDRKHTPTDGSKSASEIDQDNENSLTSELVEKISNEIQKSDKDQSTSIKEEKTELIYDNKEEHIEHENKNKEYNQDEFPQLIDEETKTTENILTSDSLVLDENLLVSSTDNQIEEERNEDSEIETNFENKPEFHDSLEDLSIIKETNVALNESSIEQNKNVSSESTQDPVKNESKLDVSLGIDASVNSIEENIDKISHAGSDMALKNDQDEVHTDVSESDEQKEPQQFIETNDKEQENIYGTESEQMENLIEKSANVDEMNLNVESETDIHSENHDNVHLETGHPEKANGQISENNNEDDGEVSPTESIDISSKESVKKISLQSKTDSSKENITGENIIQDVSSEVKNMNNRGIIKVLEEDHQVTSLGREHRTRQKRKEWKRQGSNESWEPFTESPLQEDESRSEARSPLEPNLQDSGIEPSPRKERRTSTRGSRPKSKSRIPRMCNKNNIDLDDSIPISTVSVTQAVQYSVRKYHLERRIFHQLLELKRLQIRSGRSSEGVLVKRLVDDYKRAGLMLGLQQYNGVYTFRAFEKYLYDQLRLLQSSERRIIPRLKSTDDLERLTSALKKTRAGQEILTTIPNNPALCTYQTHRCHHATHAYTGIPCAAYIRRNHHTMPKPGSFLPKLVQGERGGELAKTLRFVDPTRPLTLELSHGTEKQVITLPTEKLDKSKRYFVTFTIKTGNQKKMEGDKGHTHASSV